MAYICSCWDGLVSEVGCSPGDDIPVRVCRAVLFQVLEVLVGLLILLRVLREERLLVLLVGLPALLVGGAATGADQDR